jgi:hypothetical protein
VRRRGLSPAAIAAIAVLSGCGSTSTTSTRTSAATTTITTTRTLGATPTGAGPAPAHAASSGCRSGQIAVTPGVRGAGLGHVGVVLRFRSTGSATCTLSGYPGATLVTAGGRDVPARRTLNGYLGGVSGAGGGSDRVPVVRVRPGETVSAMLEGLDSDPAHGGGSCPRYAHLLVTPPNQTVTARMTSPLTAICRPEVHPVVPGTSGRLPS